MTRSATAVWNGSLKEGEGHIDANSGAFVGLPYSFAKRFGEEPGTNPEELIASAHSGCFAMASSAELGNAGITPESVTATAAVTLEPVDGKPTVTKSHLTCTVVAPGADEAAVRAAVNGAKAGCPISRLLNAEITLDLTVQV